MRICDVQGYEVFDIKGQIRTLILFVVFGCNIKIRQLLRVQPLSKRVATTSNPIGGLYPS